MLEDCHSHSYNNTAPQHSNTTYHGITIQQQHSTATPHTTVPQYNSTIAPQYSNTAHHGTTTPQHPSNTTQRNTETPPHPHSGSQAFYFQNCICCRNTCLHETSAIELFFNFSFH
jgi:hypothetical protein